MGTVTESCVAPAAVTAAWVAPKYTMLLEGVALKLVPVMVTVVPTGPLAGAKEAIVGGDGETILRKMETELLFWFAIAMSGFPSPSRSPMAILLGDILVTKSTLALKEPAVIAPMEQVFLKTETQLPPVCATAKSGFPSPSRSPMAIP